VYPGRKYTLGGEPLWEPMEHTYGVSRHYTIVFTVFVFLQIFNMICSRKINDEKNVFDGFFRNTLYVIIVVSITVVQVIITQFTADIFRVARGGLSIE
jgi:Ca2+ transporting ATPase